MPDRSIILHPHEILRLKSAGSVVVRRAVTPRDIKWHRGCGPKDFDSIGTIKDGIARLKKWEGVSVGSLRQRWHPGEQLWVKETWAVDHCYDHLSARDVPQKSPLKWYGDYTKSWHKVRSPSTMPRWASRFTVVASELRCEKVQDIDEDDAANSGFDTHGMALRVAPGGMLPCVALFAEQWDRDNRRPETNFEANPWVFRGLMTRVE